MGIKQKLGLGAASAVLGLSLIGGGTYAYFSDTAETNGTFAAGTLDLNAQPTEIIKLDKMKPGDYITKRFSLGNSGTIDIGEISLKSSYVVTDAKGDNTDDFGKHINVEFLFNNDKGSFPVYEATLYELQNMSPEALKAGFFSGWITEKGGLLKAGTSDTFTVKFKFINEEVDQNQFQGDSLKIDWKFEAKQVKGENRN